MKNRKTKDTIACFFLLFLVGWSSYAQETQAKSKVVWFRNTSVVFSNSFYMGNNMIADAHRTHNMGFEVKLGIIRYQNIGLNLFAGSTGLRVKNRQMIGKVDNSTQSKGGASLYYFWEVSPQSTLKPEIGIYDSSFRSSSSSEKIESMSGLGYLIGTEYQYDITKGFRAVVGLHYHWNKYNVRTAPQYKNYFKQAQYFQLSIGVNF
ncbi:hypothetical protein [Myroides fluvii]|uniref:hypothetical protein n=1 Tax=Myroides fluvii TaxID=2572594 RepID=UPI00131CBC14|nr:hypothetical protein [Myroides fluvii]